MKEGTLVHGHRLYSDDDIKLKTLNQFLVKYRNKFHAKASNPFLPNPKEEEEGNVGIKGVMVDFDQFFNGKREPKEMKAAFEESRKNLGHLKYM